MEKHEEAFIYLNKSLEIETVDTLIITSEEIYHIMNKYEEALVYFNKSLKIRPNGAFELRNRGGNPSCIRQM